MKSIAALGKHFGDTRLRSVPTKTARFCGELEICLPEKSATGQIVIAEA
ncbi:hypothetical protein [Allorhodopirellula heiligendammensis]|nr:hypothetical protein [Allorhodopirellula heiligendammensis]